MSVFQIQEWWNHKLSDEEEFDHGNLYYSPWFDR